jgi:hypothetical protein
MDMYILIKAKGLSHTYVLINQLNYSDLFDLIYNQLVQL